MTRLAVPERAFQAAVEELARYCGWRVYHAHDSRRSEPGWPDIAAVRGDRMICAELKSRTGRVTREQADWLIALERVPGIETYTWREPVSWPEIREALR
jgi:Holliday junction resolvase